MKKLSTSFPLGRSEKINVAVQRPTVNVREAENVGEQMAAANRQAAPAPGVPSEPIGSPFKKSGWGGGHLHNVWD